MAMAVGVAGAVMVAFALAFLVAVAIMATVVVVARVVARALVTCSFRGGKGGGVDDHGLCCVGGGQGVWRERWWLTSSAVARAVVFWS